MVWVWIAAVGSLAGLPGALTAADTSAVSPPAVLVDGQFAWRLKAYTAKDGLPQLTPTEILQTNDGYLWITTFGGLSRFNGKEFKNYLFADTAELVSDRMTALHEDYEGVLWIGHEGGGVTVRRNNRFEEFTPARQLPAFAITALARTGDGVLWLSLGDGRLATCQGEACALYSTEREIDSVRTLYLANDDTLWVGTDKGVFGIRAGELLNLPAPPTPSLAGVRDLTQDDQGHLLVAAQAGVFMLDESRWRLVYQYPPGQPIRAMTVDNRGNLWLGTASQLLALPALAESPEAPAYGPATIIHPEIFDTLIWSLTVDREGSIWVGAQGRGLAQLTPEIVRRYSEESGLIRRETLAVVADGAGGIFVASGCASPLLHLQNGTFADMPLPKELPYPCLHSLLRDRAGALWVGLVSQVARYQDDQWEIFKLSDEKATGPVRALFESSDGQLWAGTEKSGLFRLQDSIFERLSRSRGQSTDDVRFITETRDGALWLGTRGGAIRMHNGERRLFATGDGLPPGTVRSIHEDHDGSLWIGTYGGGLGYLSGEEISVVNETHGLFENVVSALVDDKAGQFWMLGNRGIYLAQRDDLKAVIAGHQQKLTSVAFTEREGMIEGSGGTQNSGISMSDGTMWFTTMDGLAHINAAQFQLNQIRPAVAIEELRVDGERVSSTTGRVELPAGRHNLEIDYAGLSYLQPDRMQFMFRMEGFDEGWRQVGNRRVAYYSDLPPGDYTFRVRAANSHGLWNESGASLQVRKAARFYETRFFILSAAAIFLLLVYAFYALRLRRINAHNAQLSQINRRLEREVHERQRAEAMAELNNERLAETNAALETRNREMERFTYTVSHDLKSPLVTIKGFLRLLEEDVDSNDTEQVRDDIERIRHAADNMGTLLDELLELSRVGRKSNPPQVVDLARLAHEAAELTAGESAVAGARIEIADNLPDVFGDRARLLQVFQNLLDNAVKYIGDTKRPLIEVGATARKDDVLCYVKDNGSGIDPRHHELVFGLFERADAASEGTGIGLTLVQRIIETHNGKIWIESEGKGHGTTIWFTLPLPPE